MCFNKTYLILSFLLYCILFYSILFYLISFYSEKFWQKGVEGTKYREYLIGLFHDLNHLLNFSSHPKYPFVSPTSACVSKMSDFYWPPSPLSANVRIWLTPPPPKVADVINEWTLKEEPPRRTIKMDQLYWPAGPTTS